MMYVCVFWLGVLLEFAVDGRWMLRMEKKEEGNESEMNRSSLLTVRPAVTDLTWQRRWMSQSLTEPESISDRHTRFTTAATLRNSSMVQDYVAANEYTVMLYSRGDYLNEYKVKETGACLI
jgi:hypothetical protein